MSVNFINVFCALFLYESLCLAPFSSYTLALAKNSYKKTRAYNVDEIDGRIYCNTYEWIENKNG